MFYNNELASLPKEATEKPIVSSYCESILYEPIFIITDWNRLEKYFMSDLKYSLTNILNPQYLFFFKILDNSIT